ncbi:MAG: KOW domain-containing RNA-binding protein [Lachnospiraceae bacterium]|nr:KOW domain-containing RNA-binding protein [Lachnospiraceae bacterium]
MNRQSSVGLLASSLAGHDKNKIYLIIKEEEDWFWLADGKDRRLENPKKKNKKHVQLIRYYTDRELTENIHQDKDFSDLKIKRMIKAYERFRKEEK